MRGKAIGSPITNPLFGSKTVRAYEADTFDADFDYKTLPSCPASRDSVLDAIRNCRIAMLDRKLSDDPAATFECCAEVLATAEWFDFGAIEAQALSDASVDAMPFFNEGLLRAPYDRCIFRARLYTDDALPKAEVEVVIIIDERSELPPNYRDGISIIQLRCNGARAEYVSLVSAVGVQGGKPMAVGGNAESSKVLMYEYLGLWTILNAKGVNKIVEEAGPRLQRARARSGKPPLQRVTRVDARQYVTALNETVRMEGDYHPHGSPKMHLRRGHLRRYEHDRYSRLPLDRRVQWIPAMIINGTGDVDKNRDAYRVVRK